MAPKIGTFEELVSTATDDIRPILDQMRAIVLSIDPEAVEIVRLGDRAATYGVGSKKMKEGYCYVMPHKKWANLGFYQGATLPDPEGLLEGTGAKMRHVKIRTLEAANSAAIKALIKAALNERRSALGIDG